ncbi:MAG: hypothetical protein NTV23_12215 [Propionibacteriales bacterium]|nr:hypothetical protein [Propionibacteriales bacterium]
MAKEPNRLVAWFRTTLDEQPVLGQALIAAAVLVATVLLGAVIGTAVAGGGSSSAGGPSGVVGLRPAVIGELIPAPQAEPATLEKPRGMGSKSAGIALLALSKVDSVVTEQETRRAPEGSRMMAFRVGDWDCEITPCASWASLSPVISIDGQESSLEEGKSTYVVVVPPGTNDVSLQIDADGFPQSLSLLSDDTGQNITVLAEPSRLDPIPVSQRFRLGERTSTPLTGPDGMPTDAFFRTVSIGNVQRHFFLGPLTPGSPDNVFLVVAVAYTYDGQAGSSAFDPSELRFVLSGGRSVPARDLDPDPAVVTLGFEVPAGAKSGSLVFGGEFAKQSTTGVGYTSTLETRRVKVDLDR